MTDQNNTPEPSFIHACSKDDMHPYNCEGDPPCIHCESKITETHNPANCALCHWEDMSRD